MSKIKVLRNDNLFCRQKFAAVCRRKVQFSASPLNYFLTNDDTAAGFYYI